MDTNPFLHQNIVKDMDLFYGRKKLLQQLVEHIIKGESCAIVGEHKIGKSSILNYLTNVTTWGDISLNHDTYKIIYFDFQSEPLLTPGILWRTLLQDMATKIPDEEIQESVRLFCQEKEFFFRDVRLILENIKQKQYKVVLLFDEFDYLADHLETFGIVYIDAFRSLTREYLVMVVAARKKISDLFPKKQGGASPLHNVFETMSVGLLEESAALDLITQIQKPTFPSLLEERMKILHTAGKHPFVLQRLCYHVFNYKRDTGYINDSLFEKAVANCYEDLVSMFDDIWGGLTTEQKNIIILISKENSVKLNQLMHGGAAKFFRELRELGVVETIADDVFLFSGLFSQYIRFEKETHSETLFMLEEVQNQKISGKYSPSPLLGKRLSSAQVSSNNNQTVFISYAWGGQREEIVNQIDQSLQSRGLMIIRDKRDLGYKGSIKGFMESIGLGDCIIVVVSDKYLRSPNCMFELVEIAQNKQFHERIFPVVLADADIYNPVKQIQYIKYWEEQIKELKETIGTVDPTHLEGIYDQLNLYARIRENISRLTAILSDMNTLTPEMHQESDFSNLYAAIEKRMKER